MREEAAQRHIQNEFAEIVSPADLEAIQSKMLTWRDQQKKAGLLPTDAEITSKGAEYARIFDDLVKKDVEILPEGLFAAGNEYLSADRQTSQLMNGDRFLVESRKNIDREFGFKIPF